MVHRLYVFILSVLCSSSSSLIKCPQSLIPTCLYALTAMHIMYACMYVVVDRRIRMHRELCVCVYIDVCVDLERALLN